MQRAGKLPLRKCVGCQEMFEKRRLLRVVVTPEGEITIDPTGRQNGRGAYLCQSSGCLALARKKKSLDRALKMTVPAPVYEDLVTRFEEVVR